MSQTWKKAASIAIAAAGSVVVMGCASVSSDGPAIRMQSVEDDAGPQVTRARVVAELREAQRLRLVTVGEEDVPQPSAEQNGMITAAGNRAAEEAAKLAKSH